MTYYHYAGFLAVIGVGVLLAFVVTGGYYPIATVNGSLISSREFQNDYRAGSSYYLKLLELYAEQRNSSGSRPNSLDLQLSVLNELIENKLVDQGMRQELGEDSDDLVNGKLRSLEGDGELRQAAATLYGLTFADFRKVVLVPQAKRDILSEWLLTRGDKFDEWLSSLKKKSRVKVFSPQFHWDGEKVETR